MAVVQIKHHPIKSGGIIRYCRGTLGYGNDSSAPKPCMDSRSSSDEDFIGSKTAIYEAVFVLIFSCVRIYHVQKQN